MSHAHDSEEGLPDLDFGQTLGTFWGVDARSNIDDTYFSGEDSVVDGVYCGYKYQCVEYSRRVLILVHGAVFPQCTRASEIFAFDKATDVEKGTEYPFVACKNGETTVKPEPGMLLIYPYVPEVLPWGHVAVITEVGDTWVGIAEQNQANKSWEGKPYGRKADLLRDDVTGAWSIKEVLPENHIRDALGWKFIEGMPRRTPVSGSGHAVSYASLKPLPQFLSPRDPPKLSRYRLPAEPMLDASSESSLTAQLARELPSIDAEPTPSPGQVWINPSQGWLSVYYGTETYGTGSIAASGAGFQLIGHSVRATVAKMSDEEVAARYAIPAMFVPAARLQLREFTHCSLIGSVVNAFDPEKQAWQLVQSRLDSQRPYADIVAGSAFVNNRGHGRTWHPCTSNQDINRAVRRIALLKRASEHRKDVNTTIVVLDVLDAVDVSHVLSPVEQQEVRLSHLDLQTMATQWREWREECLQAIARGEGTMEHDGPSFTVETVALSDPRLSIQAGVILLDGRRVDFVFKNCPWKILFKVHAAALASGKHPKLAAFMTAAAVDSKPIATVFQPLWTHLTDQPIALHDAATWAATGAAAGDATATLLSAVAPPASAFDAEHRCTVALHCPDEVKPLHKVFRTEAQLKRPHHDATTYVASQVFLANGRWSVGCYREARQVPPAGSAAPPTVKDAVHVGITGLNFNGTDLDSMLESDAIEE